MLKMVCGTYIWFYLMPIILINLYIFYLPYLSCKTNELQKLLYLKDIKNPRQVLEDNF